MPAAVSFKLALALAEAGRFDEADRIFVNRFFASEELGTNVRDVYLEVRLMRARDAARHQQCGDALAVIDRLADPVEGIPFTRDGLDAFLQSARRQQQIGEVEAACGRADRARDRWRGLDRSTTLPVLDLAFAYRSGARCLPDKRQRVPRRRGSGVAAAARAVPCGGYPADRGRRHGRVRNHPLRARPAACRTRTSGRSEGEFPCRAADPRPGAVAPPRARRDGAMISCTFTCSALAPPHLRTRRDRPPQVRATRCRRTS